MAAKKAGAGSGRLSYTETMEKAIREMGDIDEFVNAKDVIVLKLDAPLPARCRIPPSLTVDVDRLRLTTNCEGFAGCQRFLAKYRCPSVVLAGLPKLGSVPSFLNAAREVLCGTQTLIIVHNRDRILDLVGWFRCPVVMLYHDLWLQPDHGGIPPPGLDRFPHLVALYGTTPALGCDQLYLSDENILPFMENAHKLAILQAPMRDVVLSARVSDTPYLELALNIPLFAHCEEMTLGCHVWSRCGTAKTVGPSASVDVVKEAFMLCPLLRRLRVTTDSKEVLVLIAKFSRLTRLSLMYVNKDHPFPFDPDVTRLLRALPSLTHLTLSYFKGVSLSAIAETCRNLQSLALFGCEVLEQSFDHGAFPKLTSLSLDWLIKAWSFRSLLLCTAQSLTDLCLEGGRVCADFLAPPLFVPYRRLQRLTLKTDKPLTKLGACPKDLHALFERLPVLERLSTDSYDIRLFVQCYHPRVKLSWTLCTVCHAEYPRVNAGQEKMWRKVHTDTRA